MKLFTNIATLLTNAPLCENKSSQVTKKDLGVIKDAWLLVDGDGKVSSFER